MIFKSKKVKTAMAALAILTVFGGSISSSYAAELTNGQSVVLASQQRIDLKTTLKHESKDEASSANTYLKDSYLKVENGKRYMVLVLSSGKLMKSVVPTINGQEVKYENVLDGDTRTISFEISSLKDDIRVKFEINPFGNFIVNAATRVEAEIVAGSTDKEDKDDTVTGPTQKPEQTPEQDKEDNKEDNKEDKDDNKEEDKDDKNDNVDNGNNGSNNGSNGSTSDKDNNNDAPSNGTLKNGHYQVKNVVVLDNQIGYSMVRGILNETSNVEIKDGKYYLTFEMGQSSLMKNIVIKANSKTLSYTKTNVGNDTIRIKVQIPSLSTKLNISTYIDAMGRTVDFDLKLNQSTLKFVSSNQEAQLPENNNTPNIPGGITGGGSNDSNSGSNDTVVGETTQKGKLYTIQNNVVHNNETGRQMARKYLNQTSKVEEIDGQLYLTLTFTGVNLMNNHKIYVNGSLVNYQVTASSSTSKSYRFKISSLKDDIKVSAYIIPMSRSVEFGVKLLENTYTFVKDIEGTNGSLPQTGSVINAESMLAGGSLITALGAFIGRRKRK
ncbi:NEAT domain-containing protein [Intestinibacter bartlettii]|uniref:NEAT domain-containing protein n=1 Tax=Intestinibacter bartlettii TaxID=261299 RepID=A0ABS6DYP0_9FIRM|nr:NEAT domain-containing protein [Intestinibacter bartlettii]MBU5336867.1 NEAT domain-containing protein [Intestinibacter bartlettii]